MQLSSLKSFCVSRAKDKSVNIPQGFHEVAKLQISSTFHRVFPAFELGRELSTTPCGCFLGVSSPYVWIKRDLKTATYFPVYVYPENVIMLI